MDVLVVTLLHHNFKHQYGVILLPEEIRDPWVDNILIRGYYAALEVFCLFESIQLNLGTLRVPLP